MEAILMPDNQRITRRGLLRTGTAGAATLLVPGLAHTAEPPDPCPSFLKNYESLYRKDPRAARLAWFRNARFGLFMHYGLYSLLGHGEWVMLKEVIPVAEYEKLAERFTAAHFDADRITDLALAAGMKYVNLTARHHDSFCLFRTKQSDYSTVATAAKRDLVGELADACRRKGLGLFLYYSYALDWRHPYFYPPTKRFPQARPAYKTPEPSYKFEKDEDFDHYLRFVHAQIRELLTQYGPLAGIWLDPLMGYYARPDLFPIDKTYAMIRATQPGCLISFKQGANGDEDFAAPERKAAALRRGGERALKAWQKNRGKPVEICDTLQPRTWGYDKRADGKHKTDDDVMKMLADAKERGANLLLNTGPRPDGSIDPVDEATLREVGRPLRNA
jgi:alpha-L-fucosidase